MSAYLETLALLLVVHALCDYPLQGDFLSKAKNPNAQFFGVPWYQAMGAHAAIHAGGVWLVTGSWLFAGLEFLTHSVVDLAKCHGDLTFNQDQAAHVVCKVLWALGGGR